MSCTCFVGYAIFSKENTVAKNETDILSCIDLQILCSHYHTTMTPKATESPFVVSSMNILFDQRQTTGFSGLDANLHLNILIKVSLISRTFD